MYSKHKSKITNVNTNNTPWYYISPKPEKQEILGIVSAFNPAELRILNIILLLCKRYKLVYACQQTIARMAKVSRGYLNLVLKYFAQLGLIAKKWNGHNRSCWYKTSTWFNDLFVQESLSKKLPIFYFTLAMLFSPAEADITRCINDLYLYNTTTSSATSLTTTILSKNFKKEKMFEAQHEISEQVRNLNLNLSVLQQQQLSKFHPTVLARAEARLKTKKNPNDPVSYFFWLCKDEQANPTVAKEVVARSFKKVEEVAKKAYVEQFKDADIGIVPNIDLEFDENIQKWLAYEQQAASWSEQSDFHRNVLANRKRDFMKALDKHTPENLLRWREKAAELRRLFPYTPEGLRGIANMLEIKPESTTLNDIPVAQHNNQQNKKDSSMVKFGAISKYRQHKDFEQIRDFINGINYDPENEEEDFDSPLML